jgi:hypothetical protein
MVSSSAFASCCSIFPHANHLGDEQNARDVKKHRTGEPRHAVHFTAAKRVGFGPQVLGSRFVGNMTWKVVPFPCSAE